MSTTEPLSFPSALAALKAAGEATRLRILALLTHSELTVKDLTAILGQSQPRISRHLKLLVEADLIERNPEGAWVFYRLTDGSAARQFVARFFAFVDPDDQLLKRDRERLAGVKREQADVAAEYFTANASDWDAIRALHVADDAVEAAMLDALGGQSFEALLDLGTGTGRILELLAPFFNRAVGIDASTDMLAVARANLDRTHLANAQVRLGDIRNLPFARDSFDLVTIHQVLHFLDDPERAIAEAARVLRPGGRLLVVDFAPHELEFLRENHAHRRLGFARSVLDRWIEGAGLAPADHHELPGAGDADLTVFLWAARDPRMVIADRNNIADELEANSQEIA